jgi:hypothetical protein
VRFIGPGTRLFDGNLEATTPAFFSVDGGTKKVADWAVTKSPADFGSPPNSNLAPNDPLNDRGFGTTLGKLTTAGDRLQMSLTRH